MSPFAACWLALFCCLASPVWAACPRGTSRCALVTFEGKTGEFEVKMGQYSTSGGSKKAAAAAFQDDQQETGWNRLSVRSFSLSEDIHLTPSSDDLAQSFAAGFAEIAVTHDLAFSSLANLIGAIAEGDAPILGEGKAGEKSFETTRVRSFLELVGFNGEAAAQLRQEVRNAMLLAHVHKAKNGTSEDRTGVRVFMAHVRRSRSWLDVVERFVAWMEKNEQYVAQQVAANPSSAYWHHVATTQAQIDGIATGYARVAPVYEPMAEAELKLMSTMADLPAILTASDVANRTAAGAEPLRPPQNDAEAHRANLFGCSSLVKRLPNGDVLLSHDTWSMFESMLRLFKRYEFDWNPKSPGGPVAANQAFFSSYPCAVSSIDDFYENAPSRLVVTETTNNVFNMSLFNFVAPQSVLSTLRVVVANRLSHDGSQWLQTFARENSGTYNNQWYVRLCSSSSSFNLTPL
jgi:Phospholipase B